MFVVIIIFTLRILSVNNLTIIDPEFPEYTEDEFNMTRMLSTASPYNIEEQCRPLKAWFLTRHGTKYPSDDVLKNIREKLLPIIQKEILNVYAEESDKNFSMLQDKQKPIIKRIKEWKNVMASGTHKGINEDGKLLMTNLGKRWNNKLKHLTKNLKLDEIEVISAVEDRCIVSGKKFLRSFFEGDVDEIIIKTASTDDMRLKLVKPPKTYVNVMDPTTTKLIPVEDIYFRNHSPSIIERIQNLLFPSHVENYQKSRDLITGEMVQIMYSACAHSYYYADNHGTKADAWCHVFTFEDFKIFEEMEDLKYYYQNGYLIGHNINMGNAIMTDLQNFITDSKGVKFKLFIGHTSNVFSVIARFNLFRDEVQLTPDNIHTSTKRKWKSSFITPLGCNIMVVVYYCGYTMLRVTLYLNEIPIKMVMKNNETCTKCPLNEFNEMLDGFNMKAHLTFSDSIKEANLEYILEKQKIEKKRQSDQEKERIARVQEDDASIIAEANQSQQTVEIEKIE